MFDSVPWFVGGGAQHSPEVARLLAYASTSGAEGIVTPADMKVTPLAVPGGAVQVLPGAALIRHRGAGGAQQTYVARLPVADQVSVAATGSGAGRTDLIVAQIEDPFTAGEPWQEPSDPTVGPYVFTRVISNVPAGTTRLQDVPGYEGRSAVTLARVTLPASTGTVTAGMIADLRDVAVPRRSSDLQVVHLGAVSQLAVSTTMQPWPLASNGGQVASLRIPEWATHAQMLITYSAIVMRAGSYGNTRATLGPLQFAGAWDTQAGTGTDPYQMPFFLASALIIPESIRGTTQPLSLHAAPATSGQSAATQPTAIAATRVVVQVEFEERAV